MTRRDLMKVATLTALTSVTASAFDKKLVVNTTDVTPKDPKNLTKGEKKHTPDISLKGIDKAGYTLVEVTVGQDDIIHPSTKEHWIYEIELYADDKKIDTVSLEPIISRGYLGTRVKLDGVKTLKAVSKCNLHGNYTNILVLA